MRGLRNIVCYICKSIAQIEVFRSGIIPENELLCK